MEELKLLHPFVYSESCNSARSGPLDQKFSHLSETKNHVGRLLGPPTETLSEDHESASLTSAAQNRVGVAVLEAARSQAVSATLAEHLITPPCADPPSCGRFLTCCRGEPSILIFAKKYQVGDLVQTLMMVFFCFFVCL